MVGSFFNDHGLLLPILKKGFGMFGYGKTILPYFSLFLFFGAEKRNVAEYPCSIVTVPQATHYIIDGFIWRLSKGKLFGQRKFYEKMLSYRFWKKQYWGWMNFEATAMIQFYSNDFSGYILYSFLNYFQRWLIQIVLENLNIWNKVGSIYLNQKILRLLFLFWRTIPVRSSNLEVH